MRKIIIFVLVGFIISFSALPVGAELKLGDVKISGEFRTRWFSLNDVDFSELTDDTDSWVDMRFRLDNSLTVGPVTGFFQLDLVNGDDFLTDLDNDGVLDSSEGNIVFGRRDPTGGSSNKNTIGVRQVYGSLAITGNSTLVAGRKEVTLGHGLVMRNTVDLVSLSHEMEMIKIRGALWKLADSVVPRPPSGVLTDRSEAYVFDLEVRPMREFTGAVFVIFGQPFGDELVVVGPYGHLRFGPIGLHAEADFLTGDFTDASFQKHDFEGTNVYAAAYASLPPLTVGGSFLFASGQEGIGRAGSADPGDVALGQDININSISGDFRMGRILFRDRFNNHDGVRDVADPLSRRPACGDILNPGAVPDIGCKGVARGNLGVVAYSGFAKIKPFERLDLTARVIFATTDEDDLDGQDDLGTEVDVEAAYRLGDNFSIDIAYAGLFGADAATCAVDTGAGGVCDRDLGTAGFQSGGRDAEDIHQVEVGLIYKF